MKLSTKANLTVFTLLALIVAHVVWNLVESPTRGAVTAAQLDDTVQSFAIAKAVSNNYVESAIFIIWVFAVGALWTVVPLSKTEK